MNKEEFGIIHDYYPREKMISIKKRNSLSFFYFSKSALQLFKRAMEHESVFVEIEYSDKEKVLKNIIAKEITVIHKIQYQTKKGPKSLFDVSVIKEDVKKLINLDTYKAFLDFELTMPAYNERHPFTPEIIQIGMVIANEKDEIVNIYTTYVNPEVPISDRAKRFLGISKESFKDAVSYDQFYNEYKNLLSIYRPIIYVWGSNDVKALNDSFTLHKVKPLKARYEDLLKHHKHYYELKNDLGLFTALKIYRGIEADQVHHALTDATATKEVFDGFKKKVNGLIDIEIKNGPQSADAV
ncbi:MAG: hypothetical protein H6687_01425 [Bacillales bacterium]|nr:hypothetical protein [Bacillales bacterium]